MLGLAMYKRFEETIDRIIALNKIAISSNTEFDDKVIQLNTPRKFNFNQF